MVVSFWIFLDGGIFGGCIKDWFYEEMLYLVEEGWFGVFLKYVD